MVQKFRPWADRILVQRQEQEVTSGGIIIPDTAKEKAQTGVVISVGAGKMDASGKVMPLHVKQGDTVYFGKYAGTEAAFGTSADSNYIIIREDEILGIVEK